MVLGADGVENFRISRRTKNQTGFDHQFQSNGKLKPEVIRWRKMLKEKTEDSSIHLLLQFTRQLLHRDPNQRPEARVVELKILFCYISSLSSSIRTAYTDVYRLCQGVYIYVEKERFRLWCTALGIFDEESLQTANEHDQTHSFADIPDILLKIERQLLSLKSALSSGTSGRSNITDNSLDLIQQTEIVLQNYNNQLEEHSSMRFREEMRRSLNRSLIQDPDHLQDAQTLARTQDNDDLGALVSLKMRTKAITDPTNDSLRQVQGNLLLKKKDVKFERMFGQHRLGWLDETKENNSTTES